MTNLDSLFGKPAAASEAPRQDEPEIKREQTPQEKLKASLGGLKFAQPAAPVSPTNPTAVAPPTVIAPTPVPAAPVPDGNGVDLSGLLSSPDAGVSVIGEIDVDLEGDKQEAIPGTELEQLQASLLALKDSFDHPEIVGDAIRNVMVLLQQNPFLRENMHPEDCGSMVRALRESYGRTIAKKETAKSKRVSKAKEVDSIVDALGDLGI